MCRMFYMRIKESIPNTVEKRAEYWKKYYNTPLDLFKRSYEDVKIADCDSVEW